MQNLKYIEILENGGAELRSTEGSVLRVTVWAIAVFASVVGTLDYGIIGSLVAVPIMLLDRYAMSVIRREGRYELLAYYAAINEPVFEWQQAEDDGEVFNRATEHRKLLTESGNSLFAKGKIEVVEMYFRDPQFDYCETFEEFEQRRSDMKKDYLRDWAKRITKTDDAWRKQFLHGQRGIQLNGEEVLL